MILKGLQLISAQLNEYIEPLSGPDEVVLGNIALSESPGQDAIIDKVVISLVNVEEESTLKNTIAYQKINNIVRYSDPPVFLNLYVNSS